MCPDDSPPGPAAPRRRLLTGPAGSGKTHAALERIRAAATAPGRRGRGAGAPGEALLVLPTYAQVMHVKRLALSRWDARGILDDPFTTFTAAGERFLPGFHVRGLPSAEERDRLMEEALGRADVPLFHRIADRPGFRSKLLRLVKELKQTGLSGAEARSRMAAARADESLGLSDVARARMDGFLQVFAAYEALLTQAGLEDHEDALRRLAAALAPSDSTGIPIPRTLLPTTLLPTTLLPRTLVVDGFDDFTAVEETILFHLADAVHAGGGEVLVTLPWDEARPRLFANSAGVRARLLARGFEEEYCTGFPRSDAPPLVRLATSLFAEGAAEAREPASAREPLEGGASVQLLIAGDAEDEAETIARTVRHVVQRETGVGVRGWRDVGVVVRSLDDFTPRLEAAFERLGVPLRVVGAGAPLASEPVLRALRGPLRVLAGQVEAGAFTAADLMEWLRWLALSVPGGWSVSEVDAWDMQQRERGVPPDFAAFCVAAPETLQAQVRRLAEIAAALAESEGPAQVYDGLARAIVELAPLPAPGGFDGDGRPLAPLRDRRLGRSTAAMSRVQAILTGLRTAVERTALGGALTVAAAVQELQDALERTPLAVPDRRLDAVTLMDAEEARFWELPVVVVAGLEEGRFPLRPRQDLILRDADREILRAGSESRDTARGDSDVDATLRLPLAREKEVRERRLFYGAVTRARSRLYLSRRAYDEKGDPRECSSFLGDLERCVTPTVRVEARTPGRVSRAPEECFTRSDWKLFSAGRLGPWSQRSRAIPDTQRALAQAIEEVTHSPVRARVGALRRREPAPLWADEAARRAVLGRFLDETQLVSVSRLNEALRCPHRFFLGYVADIPRDELTFEGPVFDFLAQGSALHKAFEIALREPDTTAADAAARGVSHVGATGLDARLLAAELERAVELLRRRESDTAGPLAPWAGGIEFAFAGDRAVPLGPEDCRYRLRGYIDRIDRTPTGEVSILDYKRSVSAAEGAFKRGKDGDDLQLPLYARALEQLEDVRVVGVEWVAGLARSRRIILDADAAPLFAGRRETRPLLEEAHEDFRARLDTAEQTATDAVRRTRTGDHARRPHDPAECKSCPWKRVCRPDVEWIRAQMQAEEGGGA